MVTSGSVVTGAPVAGAVVITTGASTGRVTGRVTTDVVTGGVTGLVMCDFQV